MKAFFKKILPPPVWEFLRTIRNWKSSKRRDLSVCLSFISRSTLPISLWQKIKIINKLYRISANVESPHTQEEILSFIEAILSIPDHVEGVIVEAGCFKGSSSAKFSLAAHLANRQLYIFDSFQGLPQNTEVHDKTIFGGGAKFPEGRYRGTLNEVKSNIQQFGHIESCTFVEGWHEDTLPKFKEKVAAVYIDVDLASSTRTCLKYLYPLLQPGGVCFSQDGHLPLVLEVFDDTNFWLNEVGCTKPAITGFGKKKLISIQKE